MNGAPGILVATVGPGALNGVNVIANAQQDRVPRIVLAGLRGEESIATLCRRAGIVESLYYS